MEEGEMLYREARPIYLQLHFDSILWISFFHLLLLKFTYLLYALLPSFNLKRCIVLCFYKASELSFVSTLVSFPFVFRYFLLLLQET
ncbi:hypothetical protein BC829DRAFT_395928 [Chytridium lagenaria]|nr:hypothetical protein BC829DRAFT_395928 [Chytridium lagenaria]